MTSTENVYDKAREVLRERGWNRGAMRSSDGRVCILGAVGLAAGATNNINDLYDKAEPHEAGLLVVICEQYPEWAAALEAFPARPSADWWNDSCAKSVADVDMVLDKSARIEDEQAATR